MDINLLLREAGIGQAVGRPALDEKLVRALLSSLRPGQTLQAQVLATPRADIARLLIDGLNVTARTGRPLAPGQNLVLTVLKGGDTPQLQVQQAPQPPGSQDVLRVSLPRQLPLHETLSSLAQLATRVAPLLSDKAREALRSLLDRSLPLRQVSPDTVRQAVNDSGIFTEARMAQGKLPAPTDRKALLLQLAGAMPRRDTPPVEQPVTTALTRTTVATADAPPAPLSRAALLAGLLGKDIPALPRAAATPAGPSPQATPEQVLLDRLWRLVEASVARIQTHQAASLPADDGAPPAWQLDIPLAMPGGPTQAVELRIQRESAPDETQEAGAGWLVTVSFVFPQLGPVKAGVRLSGGRISSVFWCEHPGAAQLFEQHLPRLRSALEAAGLEVSHLAASQGRPPAQDNVAMEERLLDERV